MPPDPPPERGGDAAPGWLPRHRLAIPARPAHYCDRPELTRRCDPLRRATVVLMAPGGFGKTTVLAEACREAAAGGIPVAWMTLAREDDGAALDACVGFAFGAAGLDLLGRLDAGESALGGPHPRTDLVLRAVAAAGRPCVLALDELENATEPGAVALLNHLLRRAPPTGDGTVVADAGAATSRIPAAGVRLSESLATSHETRAAEARSLSRHWSAEAGQARNAAVTDATGLIERYSHDVSTGEAYARGITESESSQAQQLDSHVEKLAEIGGLTKNQAMNLTAEAKIGGGWDIIAKIGANGAAMWRGQTVEQDAWNRIKEYDRQHGVTESWSQVAEASRRYSTQTGDSEHRRYDRRT